jgi:hypothetical protein
MTRPAQPLGRLLALAVAALVAASPTARAAGLFADQEVDSRFKARIMKEKARQNQHAADPNGFNFTQAGNTGDAACGSQNIGNVNTGGRAGTAPRELFVFAPNAINLVSGPACK